ncbi:hypothetical protein L484_027918 [Morus notabilis]|uniref:Uncharacterized protein n=1 Tax=Morus notabilis TaxID=981085 RepID=W9SFI7_9ROSA|nr:hypothetical protein L484_027918 [Morus notabilis]
MDGYLTEALDSTDSMALYSFDHRAARISFGFVDSIKLILPSPGSTPWLPWIRSNPHFPCCAILIRLDIWTRLKIWARQI